MGGSSKRLKGGWLGLPSGISLEIILPGLVRLTQLTTKENAEGVIAREWLSRCQLEKCYVPVAKPGWEGGHFCRKKEGSRKWVLKRAH